mgnify:CR=1 FL=1
MNKILFSLFFIFTMSIYFISGAADKLGWVNDNTYRVKGLGYAREGSVEVKKKPMACEAARLDAISNLLLKFAESGIESVKGSIKVETFHDIVRKEFSGIVRGMDVVDSTYYPGKGMCTIIGEISEPGMRQKINNLARKHAR